MKKRLSYLLMIFALFMFVGSVSADTYTCKYKHNNSDTYSQFYVTDGKATYPTVPNGHGGAGSAILNWDKKLGGFSAQYYIRAGICPPNLLAFEKSMCPGCWKFLVSDDNTHDGVYKYMNDNFDHEKKAYMKMLLTSDSPSGFKYNLYDNVLIDFYNEFKNGKTHGGRQIKQYYQILDGEKFNNNTFSIDGYTFTGWRVYWTRDGQRIGQIGWNIKEGTEISDVFHRIFDTYEEEYNTKYKSSDVIELYANWEINSGFNPIKINEYALGEAECKKNYVWNKKEINGVTYEYCNVDNLTYVACGDAKDIPSQIPVIVSFAVNFLKIVAPLILIFIAIISLVKAIMSSNEDEMKKAQKSLTRKIIPALLIFFVISIVQFVIGLVADDSMISRYNSKTEAQNLSDCLDCFLNNNCEDNIYYRIHTGIEYSYYSVVTGTKMNLNSNSGDDYIDTAFYKGPINTDCESKGYFTKEEGYKYLYYPKAVDVNGICYDLKKTNVMVTVYTEALDGTAMNVEQNIYKISNGSCFYWEDRVNDYIQISCDTRIITKYYRGIKQDYCEDNSDKNDYFEHEEDKEGFRPRKIIDPADGICYYLMQEEGRYYENKTQTLFGEYQTLKQKVWRAGETCFYWSDVDNEHKPIPCH